MKPRQIRIDAGEGGETSVRQLTDHQAAA